MKSPADLVFSPAQRGLILTASILVPTPQREEWSREWLAELWHVRRSLVSIDDTFTLQAEREVTTFCLGAFPDALCLRSQSGPLAVPAAHLHGSARQTLLWLFVAAVICGTIARLLPGVNAENEAARYPIKSSVLLVREAGDDPSTPGISTQLFRKWNTTRQRFFEDLAFYRVSREAAHTATGITHWNVAHSTRNLFELLGVPVLLALPSAEVESDVPAAILSHDTWMRNFAGDPHIAGRTLRTGAMKVRIAGVAPAAAWQLPGAPDIWLLESDAQLASGSSLRANGFLFAQLSDRGLASMDGPGITIAALDLADVSIDLYGGPIIAPVEGSWGIYKFAVFLALLALPAVTSVSLGDNHVSSHRPGAKQRTWRALFLLAKFLLVAAIGFYASLDLAYCSMTGYSAMGEMLQLMICFSICLAGFRWVVADQRKRCPVCLRRVTNPATVGLASRTFLGWNGTELICMGGHALLHVPSLPTSWFSGDRWLYLDSSWDFLFGDSYVY
jgi:hypothetical protein